MILNYIYMEHKRIENLTKSLSDKRDYLYKELPNKLKVLIISDPEADKSAAALNVNIGSLTDPADFPGLAHFCEHMLFMGNEKYPKEDEYMEYLNAHSGSSNAYTDLDVTNYYFDVSNEAFPGAVDRFAQFFLKPLFLSDVVEREMKAVDSENKKNLQNDAWRFLQLQRSESNQKSAFNRFSTGNVETLNKPNIRDALLDMHKQFYSSGLMSLALLSNRSIKELEDMVDGLFHDVVQVQGLEKLKFGQVPAYDSNNLGFFYKVVPVKDTDQLAFYWILEEASKHYRNRPLSFLSGLFGHEGPNSLNSSLMSDDLISNLVAGSDNLAETFSNFYIIVTLTKRGLTEYKEVLKRVLYFVNKIQSLPINKRFFEEYQQISKMKFDFKNKEDPMSYCSDLASRMVLYHAEDILTGDYIYFGYDEVLIKKYLDSLKLENMNIYLTSKSVESSCDKTEHWYGTKYNKERFNDEIIKFSKLFELGEKVTDHNLNYPPENVFVPKSLELFPDDVKKQYPEKIYDQDNVVVWYKKDYTFKLPKTVVICQIYLNKHIRNFIEYETIAYIWNSIVENELRELSYMANEANVIVKMHTNNEGIYLQVTGFNYSTKNALSELIKVFKSINAADKSEKLKVQIIRHRQEYINFYYKNAYTQAMAYVEQLIVDPSTTANEKLKVLDKGISIDSLIDFVSKFTKESRMEWLIQGNILEEEVVQITKICQNLLTEDKLDKDKLSIYRTVNIETKHNFVFSTENVNPEDQNSVIATFLQCGFLDDKEHVILLVIESLLKDSFFNELRTKQALGYIAMLFHREYRCNEGLMCLVQSTVKSPEVIWQRITTFFDENKKTVLEISDELFKTHVNSVLTELKQKDLNLSSEAFRNAMEIKRHFFVFNRKDNYIAILENLKKEELVAFYNDKFIENSRRLDVEILAKHHFEENNAEIEANNTLCKERNINRVTVKSIMDFKRRNSLNPDFYSYK